MDFEELGVCVGVLSINVFSIVDIEENNVVFSIEIKKYTIVASYAEGEDIFVRFT